MKKIYSSKNINDACILSGALQLYENDASAFIHARKKGVEEGFNYAQKRVKDLISKVEEIDGLKNEPVFKGCIVNLKLLYDLKN